MTETLSIDVKDSVKIKELFGKLETRLKGSSGTLHVTNCEHKDIIAQKAWEISCATSKFVAILVRVNASNEDGALPVTQGVGGTLHINNEHHIIPVMDSACLLSKKTGLPVVVVVKAKK